MDTFHFYTSASTGDDPEISVILSTYNRMRPEGDCKSLLQRAIRSILQQSFPRFELILIDDASTDSSAEYCKQVVLTDPRVKFYHFQQNSGLPAKRYNFGMSVSRGKYICFMFDDDELELTALNDLHSAIENLPANYGMVYGQATVYMGSDRDHFRLLGAKWGWNRIDASNFIANNSVIVKRCAIDLVGGYDEDPIFLRICDWDLWWRIGRKFRIGRIPRKVSVVYSQLQDSLELTQTLNPSACRKRQRTRGMLPLQILRKTPLSSQIQSFLFDFYVTICQRYRLMKVARALVARLKRGAKRTLPDSLYQKLKICSFFVLRTKSKSVLKPSEGSSRVVGQGPGPSANNSKNHGVS